MIASDSIKSSKGNHHTVNGTLLLFFAKQMSIAFHEFAHQQEGVNGGDAVGDKAGDQLSLAV